MKTTFVVAGAAVILLGFCLSGCAPATTAAVAGNTPAPAGASAAPSTSPVARAGKHIDICAMLPVAKIAALTGKPYVKTNGVVDQKVSGLLASGCAYVGTDESLTGLAIDAFYASPTAAWAYITSDDNSLGTPLTTTVSGVGDRAMTNGSWDFVVQYGSDVVRIQDTSEPPSTPLLTLGQSEQLAALVHAAMQ